MKKRSIIVIVSLASAALVAGAITLAVVLINNDTTFRLDEEFYAQSEAIDIDKDKYEQLIAEKKSFIVMVDKPNCHTTKDMSSFLTSLPSNFQFKYYRLMWSEVRKSSLHGYIKFAPSLAIVKKGEVLAWLDADSEDDAEMFNNADALEKWIRKYVEF